MRPAAPLIIAVGRHHHDWQFWPAFLDLVQQRQTVHAGHIDVGENHDQLRLDAVVQLRQGIFAGRGEVHHISPWRASRRNRCRKSSATSGSSSTTKMLTLMLCFCPPAVAAPWQSYRKLRVGTQFAVYLDGAAVLLRHDLVADREPESSAFSGRLCRNKRLEQLVPDLR